LKLRQKFENKKFLDECGNGEGAEKENGRTKKQKL